MGIDRSKRVAAMIQREVARIIDTQLFDERLKLITLTDVKLTRDLRQATFYFTQMGKNTDSALAEKLLNETAGYIRKELAAVTQLRVSPTLRFTYDDLLEKGLHLRSLIEKANNND